MESNDRLNFGRERAGQNQKPVDFDEKWIAQNADFDENGPPKTRIERKRIAQNRGLTGNGSTAQNEDRPEMDRPKPRIDRKWIAQDGGSTGNGSPKTEDRPEMDRSRMGKKQKKKKKKKKKKSRSLLVSQGGSESFGFA
jgi:hypothetical protein